MPKRQIMKDLNGAVSGWALLLGWAMAGLGGVAIVYAVSEWSGDPLIGGSTGTDIMDYVWIAGAVAVGLMVLILWLRPARR